MDLIIDWIEQPSKSKARMYEFPVSQKQRTWLPDGRCLLDTSLKLDLLQVDSETLKVVSDNERLRGLRNVVIS